MKSSSLSGKKGMLTLQFIPYSEIGKLEQEEKIKKILRSVKENKIILIDGILDSIEESKLIERTMEEIDKKFKGIEIASITPNNNKEIGEKIKNEVIRFILGKRSGITVVGPATIVKEIKRNPNKIELFTRV